MICCTQEGRFQADMDFLGLVTSSASNPEAMLHGTCLRSLALLSTVGMENKGFTLHPVNA
jgi:hypothetical protein